MREQFAALLDGIRRVQPVTGLIHVGAGKGSSASQTWRQWEVPYALIVDADARVLSWAEAECRRHPGWRKKQVVVGECDGEMPFFSMSNPAESCLLEAQTLHAIWPGLQQKLLDMRSVVRLETLLDSEGGAAADADWVFIDCLPALPILKGAGPYLRRWRVLQVRAILGDDIGPEAARLPAIAAYLAQHGFYLAAMEEGTHPLLGEACFVRDMEGELRDELRQASQEVERRKTAEAELKDGLRLCQDEVASLAATTVILRHELQGAKDELYSVNSGLDAARILVEDQREESNDIRSQLLQQISALASSHELEKALLQQAVQEGQQRSEILQSQCVQLTTSVKDLDEERGQVIAQLVAQTKERNDLNARLASCGQQLDALRAEKGDLERKCALSAEQENTLQQQLAQAGRKADALQQAASLREADLTSEISKMKAALDAELDNLKAEVNAAQAALSQKDETASYREDEFRQREEKLVAEAKALKSSAAECEAASKAELANTSAQWIEREALWMQELASLKLAQAEAVEQHSRQLATIEQERQEQERKLLADQALVRKELADCVAELATAVSYQREAITNSEVLDAEKKQLAVQLEELQRGNCLLSESAQEYLGKISELEILLAERKDVDVKLHAATLEELEIKCREISDCNNQLSLSSKENATYSKTIYELEERKSMLELEVSDMAQRNRLLSEELLKAEAQLELISDLLLKDGHV